MLKQFVSSIFILFFTVTLNACASDGDCGTKTVSGVQRSLVKGPEGGCYYVNSNGNKSYVDRSECQC